MCTGCFIQMKQLIGIDSRFFDWLKVIDNFFFQRINIHLREKVSLCMTDFEVPIILLVLSATSSFSSTNVCYEVAELKRPVFKF